jgi:putative DNA primase/helicase
MTIELDTGIDRPPRREDYCTKIAGTHVAEPGAPCPMWMAFLNRVTAGNDALIGFLQRYLGYCMTGDVHEHVLVFLYGTGANGKTVFTDTVAGIFGAYAIAAPMEMFLSSNFDRHPTEIARLKGARLVVAHETTKGRAWDEVKIKNLTGGDRLTARFMRGDFFDFTPTHKLLIAGNIKPSLRNVDEGIRRRFLLVPFTVQIPPAERDPKLTEKLKAEWPAILRWMTDGCLEWQRVGLVVPTIVRDASEAYFAEQDTLRQWIEDCLDEEPNAFTASRALFISWKAWSEARNMRSGTEKAFVEELVGRGYQQHRTSYARGLNGLALKAHDGPSTEGALV